MLQVHDCTPLSSLCAKDVVHTGTAAQLQLH